MTVSATHEASDAATAASAAVPPSRRISTPARAVAGWPAATAGGRSATRRSYRRRRAGPAGDPVSPAFATLPGDRSPGRARSFPDGVLGLRSRLVGGDMSLTKEAKLEII